MTERQTDRSPAESDGPWPYTAANRRRQREALLARRRAAVEAMTLFARDTKPDPDGLTGVDYLRELRDPDRAPEEDNG